MDEKQSTDGRGDGSNISRFHNGYPVRKVVVEMPLYMLELDRMQIGVAKNALRTELKSVKRSTVLSQAEKAAWAVEINTILNKIEKVLHG